MRSVFFSVNDICINWSLKCTSCLSIILIWSQAWLCFQHDFIIGYIIEPFFFQQFQLKMLVDAYQSSLLHER